jgi:hypothetical protein
MNELQDAVTIASQLRDEVEGGDLTTSQADFEQFGVHAQAAASLSDDPIWRTFEALPFLGPNLTGVRVASHTLDQMSRRVVKPLMAFEGQLSDVVSDEGLNLDVLQRAQKPLADADQTMKRGLSELESLDETVMIPRVAGGVRTLRRYVGDVEPIVAAASQTVAMLPSMLGANEPRSVLILLQNGAELRTGGGLAGSFAEMSAENGKLRIVAQASSTDFPVSPIPVVPLPDSVRALHGDAVGRYVMNATTPADYPLTAQLASQWWQLHSGHRPDTVISVDVPTLGAALSAIGPVDVPEWGPVDSNNVVQRLLIDPYLSLSSDAKQNALFQVVLTSVFDRLFQPGIDPISLATSLSEPIAEGRVSVWSSRADEQSLFAESALGGPAVRQRMAGPDSYAVYLNDHTGAKMDSFLDVSIATGVASCRSDGRRDIRLSVTLTSRAPADAGTALPPRMTGDGASGVPAGIISTLVAVSAPSGTFVGGVTSAGAHVDSVSSEDEAGFIVSQSQSDLAPGTSQTLEFRFVAAEPGLVSPTILHTPLLGEPEITVAPGECS